MRVQYRDLETGKTAWQTGLSMFDLSDGNYSCDCNRASAFMAYGEYDAPCQCKRYLVVAVCPEPGDDPFIPEDVIREANDEYKVPHL